MQAPGSPEALNLAAYSKPSVARWFGDRQGYYDLGERSVLAAIAAEMDGRTILDIGVGAGRTIPLLRAISEDYRAIDYSHEMVQLCRRLHPGIEVDVGDARDLSRFASDSTDLVVFSCAGLDHMDHDDRQSVFCEIHRVLKPGGLFVFSTHNMGGPGHGEKPWGSLRELTQLKHMAGLILFFPINMRNHWRNRKLDVHGLGWSMRNSAFDHFSMVFHYTTVSNQIADLVAAGFGPSPEVYESDSGRRVEPGEEPESWSLYMITRR